MSDLVICEHAEDCWDPECPHKIPHKYAMEFNDRGMAPCKGHCRARVEESDCVEIENPRRD